MGDRPRRPDEDVVSWAVETQRIPEARASLYRQYLATGQIAASTIELLASSSLDGAAPAPIRAAANTGRPARRVAATGAGDPAAECLANDPVYRDGLSVEPAPDLFPGGGALPLATASGLAPQTMSGVPWWCRPAIAAAPTLSEAVQMLQDASTPAGVAACAVDERFVAAPGLQDFKDRVQGWAMTGIAAAGERARDAQFVEAKNVAAAARTALEDKSDDELYDILFGSVEQHRASLAETQRRHNNANNARRH